MGGVKLEYLGGTTDSDTQSKNLYHMMLEVKMYQP